AKLIPESDQAIQQLTQSGHIVGSPFYMSPEQCLGKPADKRSDVYSLGCVMYETLTGKPPHAGATPLETMSKHVSETPPPLGAPSPIALSEAIFIALNKDPDKR